MSRLTRLAGFARPTLPALLAAMLLAACGSTQQIARQQMMAPENLELAMRRDIAVVEFTGEGGQDLSLIHI